MEVNDTVPRRDYDSLSRLAKQREEEHAKELNDTREDQGKQIENLKESQKESLGEIRAKNKDESERVRERYEQSLTDLSDTYTKTANEQNKESYNKLGKMNRENIRSRNEENAVHKKHIQDIIDSSARDTESERRNVERRFVNLRDSYNGNLETLRDKYEGKLDETRDGMTESVAKAVSDARTKQDETIRRSAADVRHSKSFGELRYKELADSSAAERAAMKGSFALRERQLEDEKNLIEKRLGSAGSKTFEEYRNRSADILERQMTDNNFMTAEKDREHADQLGMQLHEQQVKQQNLAHNFRKSESEIRNQLEMEKNRNDLKESLGERRHIQDLYLNNEAQRHNFQLSTDQMRSQYKDVINDLEERSQKRAEANTREAQSKAYESQIRNNSEIQDMKQSYQQKVAAESLDHAKERYNLLRTYERRGESENSLKDAQYEDLKTHKNAEAEKIRKDADRKVAGVYRDNKNEAYAEQRKLLNYNNELQEQYKQDINTRDITGRQRLKRIQESYAKNLEKTKENFDYTTEEIKTQNAYENIKSRSEADHQRQTQLLELQARNRQLVQDYEGKMSLTADRHVSDLEKMKSDNDKAMREILKRTQMQLESDRTAHTREIEAKDRQMKEKLKVQELAFKEQIDRLKQSNELATKKS